MSLDGLLFWCVVTGRAAKRIKMIHSCTSDITTPSDDPTGARYMEVTSDPTPQVVLQLEVSGQNAYRAVHMPSLYPGVQW